MELAIFNAKMIREVILAIASHFSSESELKKAIETISTQFVNESIKFLKDIEQDNDKLYAKSDEGSLRQFINKIICMGEDGLNYNSLNDNEKKYFFWFLYMLELSISTKQTFTLFNVKTRVGTLPSGEYVVVIVDILDNSTITKMIEVYHILIDEWEQI